MSSSSSSFRLNASVLSLAARTGRLSLRSCGLSDLSGLPEQLTSQSQSQELTQSLTSIDISHNAFNNLPPALEQFTSLVSIVCDGCPLSSPTSLNVLLRCSPSLRAISLSQCKLPAAVKRVYDAAPTVGREGMKDVRVLIQALRQMKQTGETGGDESDALDEYVRVRSGPSSRSGSPHTSSQHQHQHTTASFIQDIDSRRDAANNNKQRAQVSSIFDSNSNNNNSNNSRDDPTPSYSSKSQQKTTYTIGNNDNVESGGGRGGGPSAGRRQAEQGKSQHHTSNIFQEDQNGPEIRGKRRSDYSSYTGTENSSASIHPVARMSSMQSAPFATDQNSSASASVSRGRGAGRQPISDTSGFDAPYARDGVSGAGGRGGRERNETSSASAQRGVVEAVAQKQRQSSGHANNRSEDDYRAQAHHHDDVHEHEHEHDDHNDKYGGKFNDDYDDNVHVNNNNSAIDAVSADELENMSLDELRALKERMESRENSSSSSSSSNSSKSSNSGKSAAAVAAGKAISSSSSSTPSATNSRSGFRAPYGVESDVPVSNFRRTPSGSSSSSSSSSASVVRAPYGVSSDVPAAKNTMSYRERAEQGAGRQISQIFGGGESGGGGGAGGGRGRQQFRAKDQGIF